MSVTLKSMTSHEEHKLRQNRLVLQCSITGNATPANKGRSSDIPGLAILRTEGQTAEADAIESTGISFTAPVDNNAGDSVFGLLLNLDENKADKVYSVSLTEVTSLSTGLTVTGPVSGAYLTPEGNIAINVAAAGLNLASESPTFLLVVDYREAR